MAIDQRDVPIGERDTITVPAGPLGVQGAVRASSGDINEYINPAPDPRLNSILSKTGSPLKHGIIQQMDDWVSSQAGQQYPFACRFHFNPATIGVRYETDTSALPAGQLTSEQLKGTASMAGATSIAFSLFFDRTYEVAYGPTQTNKRDLRKIGVYRDIMALECIVGARELFASTTAGEEALLGNMRMVPVHAIFGGGNGGRAGQAVAGLAFTGFITGMSVTYTLFSASMVPTRATVELSMAQIVGQGALDFQQGGGTVIDRAHAPGRSTTTSGGNVATSAPPSRYGTPGTKRPGE